MGSDDHERGRLSKLALKFGTVAAAAAALLAENTASAHGRCSRRLSIRRCGILLS